MEMLTASDQAVFAPRTMQAGDANGREDSAREVQALSEERERRRVQFRSSLIEARSYLSRAAKALSRCVTAEPQ